MRISLNLNGLVASIGALAMVMGATGCDDGVDPGTTKDTSAATDVDASTGEVTNPDTKDTGADTPDTADTAVVDPCDPNPCLNGGSCSDTAGSATCACIDNFTGDVCEVPPADPCLAYTCPTKASTCGDDANTYTTFAAGTCTNVDGAAVCDYAVDAANACATGEICYLPNGCVVPADLTTNTYGTDTSYVTSMKIGGLGATPVCGFDLDSGQENGDPEKDNGLGTLASGLGQALGGAVDLETILDEAIQDASLTILFDWLDFDGDDDADLTIKGYYGSSAIEPFDFATAAAGDGEFYVSPSSFNLATGEPLISFEGATTGSAFLGGPSDFVLGLPLGPITLTLTVSETQLAGTAAKGPKGVTLTGGELGGAVRIEELVGAINAYVDTNCDCLDLGADTSLIDYVDDVVKPSCNTPVASTCSADEICGQISQYCPAIFLLLSGDVDSDLDGNTKFDSLSVGVCLEAAPGKINGLEPVTP